MRNYVFLFFLPTFVLCSEYDKAVINAQNAQWPEAYSQLQALLIDSPDKPDLLYDAGVAAAYNQEYLQAHACFSRAAEYANDKILCKKAWFNAGNSCVACNQLPRALEYYDKILEDDPSDEYALHNKKIVEQMLEKQKQQNQDNQDQSSQDQGSDDGQNQDNQNGGDQQSQENSKDDKHGNSSESSSNDGKKSKNQNDSKQDQQAGQQKGDGKNSDKAHDRDAGQEKGQNPEQQGADKHANNEQRKSQTPDQKLEEEAHDSQQQQKNEHNQTPQSAAGDTQNNSNEKKSENSSSIALSNDKEQTGKQANSTFGADRLEKLKEQLDDPHLVDILIAQEEKDKDMNKRLIKSAVRQNGGQHEKNGW